LNKTCFKRTLHCI